MSYDNLTQENVEHLKQIFKDLNNSKIEFAKESFLLYEEDSKQLIDLCTNTFDMCRSNIYKYVHAGKVIKFADIKLPENFSSIVPLYRVLENLKHFSEWIDAPLDTMTSREIEKAVKEYYQHFMLTDEEKETEKNIDDTIENIVDATVSIKNKSEKINEKLNQLIDELQSIDSPEVLNALEIINEIQILIGEKENDK